jgi:uncharacterized protein YutE (UPF0331/DUF86 family)
MTDRDLIEKKLAVIETCVRELRDLAQPAAITTDVRERRFVERTLQIAIQAVIDVASHIVSDERLGEPEAQSGLFDLLRTGGWISDPQVVTLKRMSGFRNILVHGYQAVAPDLVREVVEHHLDELLDYARSIRNRLD